MSAPPGQGAGLVSHLCVPSTENHERGNRAAFQAPLVGGRAHQMWPLKWVVPPSHPFQDSNTGPGGMYGEKCLEIRSSSWLDFTIPPGLQQKPACDLCAGVSCPRASKPDHP